MKKLALHIGAMFLLAVMAFAQTRTGGGGTSAGTTGITAGVVGQGLVATGGTTGTSTLAYGWDALQFTGGTNNDFCDKVGATFTSLNGSFPNRVQVVRAYSMTDQHCTWATWSAMMNSCKSGYLDIGPSRLFVDIVAGAPGMIEPTGCRMQGAGRPAGTGQGSQVQACNGLNSPIAGCAAPTFCTGPGAPVSGCAFHEGGVEQSAARSWTIASTTNVATAHTNYLQIIVSGVTPTANAWSVQKEELLQIKGSSNPTNNFAGVACATSGATNYPECPNNPVYCTGAGAPIAACTGANTAIAYIANWAKATNCAASCGTLIAPTPLAVVAADTAFNIYGGTNQFGQGFEGLQFLGNFVPGLEGISNIASQELSRCRDLIFSGFPMAAIDFYTNGAQNSGPCRDVSIGYANSANDLPATIGIRLGNYTRGLEGFTITNNSSSHTCTATAASHAGGVVTITYTANTCSPLGHMAVQVSGFATDTSVNGLFYICLPADNGSCINPTSTQFTYLVAGAGSPTGTGTVVTRPHMAVYLDQGPHILGGGGIQHVEGYDWGVCIGCNSPASGVEIDQYAGQPSASPGAGVVYISDEFATTSPFTSDYELRSIAEQTTVGGGLFTIWDLIQNPLTPLNDQTTAEYFADCQISAPTLCGFLTTSTVVQSKLYPGITLGSSSNSVTTASNTPLLNVQQTWNNASIPGPLAKLSVVNTNSVAGSAILQILGGAAGTTVETTLDSAGDVLAGGSFAALGTSGLVPYRGGLGTTNTAGTLGGAWLAGGYNSNSGASAVAGPTLVAGGMLTNAAPNAAAVEGTVQISAGFLKGTTITAQGDIVCGTATQYQVTDCPTSAANIIGIAMSTTNPIAVVIDGTVPVVTDGAVTLGDIICMSGTVAGQGHDNGTTACTNGTGIGVVVATSGTVTVIAGGATSPSTTTIALSTTKPLVAIRRH